jgi:hypothetical protein
MRDSFSSHVTSSIKDQLYTLVEEEEEEPQHLHRHQAFQSDLSGVTRSPSPVRYPPAGLNLRPLSISPDRLMSAATGDLPTPESAATPTRPLA